MVLTRGQLQRAAANQGSQPAEPSSERVVPVEPAKPAVLQEIPTNVPLASMSLNQDAQDQSTAPAPPMPKKPIVRTPTDTHQLEGGGENVARGGGSAHTHACRLPRGHAMKPAFDAISKVQQSRSTLHTRTRTRGGLQGEDRPLKPLPKVAQQTDKLPDGPEPVAVEIQYVPREELAPAEGDPIDVLAKAAVELTAADWVAVCGGLTTVRQLAAHAPADVLAQQLTTLVPSILKSVRSLRSALTKTAIMTVGDLYLSLGDAMLPHTDVGGAGAPATSLLCSLLLKAGSTEKQFVVVEAQRALECMADSLEPSQLTLLLLPYTEHKNPKVRGQAARTLARSQARLEGQAELGTDLATLLRAAGRLLTDNTPEAREAAKKLLTLVHTGFVVAPPATDAQPAATEAREEQEPQPTPWEVFCRAVLPGSTAIAVLKQETGKGASC